MTLNLTFPRPSKLVTANSRAHWAATRRALAPWRAAVAAAWQAAGQPRDIGPSTVAIRFGVPDHRRRDPSNLMPTQKAIIDELVQCGLWPDDTPDWVIEAMPTITVGEFVNIRIKPQR